MTSAAKAVVDRVCHVALAVLPAPAFASQAAVAPVAVPSASLPAAPGVGDALRVVAALALVLGIIAAAAAFARRSGRLPGVGLRELRVVETLTLGSRDRLLLVDVGADRLLLGVSAGGISALHRAPVDPAAPESQSMSKPAFGAQLSAMLTPAEAER